MTSFAKRAALPVAALLSLMMSGLVAAPAIAQQDLDPDQLALARKYVDLTDKSGVYESSIVQVGINSYRQLVSQNPGAGEQVNAAVTKVLETYKDRKDELFDQFARVYALAFTKDELQVIVDFYTTPTGQKLATANAELNGSLARVVNVYNQNLQSEFFGKVRAELRAAGIEN